MIAVHVLFDADLDYLGFRVSGHAGFDKYGKDIVCSAVSAVSIGTVNSIVELTSSDVIYEMSDSGLLKFKFADKPLHDAKLLIKSMILSLESISEQYGEEFLRIVYIQKLGKNNYIRINNQEV